MDYMNEYTRKDISLDQLHNFKGHPFAVRYDDAMNHLLDSVRISGILEPLLVRPRANGGYEILSGHRRVEAARKLGLGQVPCMIRDMNDDEATLVMTESNLTQREKLLPSEKAFAWKMRTKAARRMMLQKKGKSENERATDIVAREMGVSPRQISRIVKLTELNRQFLDCWTRTNSFWKSALNWRIFQLWSKAGSMIILGSINLLSTLRRLVNFAVPFKRMEH